MVQYPSAYQDTNTPTSSVSWPIPFAIINLHHSPTDGADPNGQDRGLQQEIGGVQPVLGNAGKFSQSTFTQAGLEHGSMLIRNVFETALSEF
jgi:hypothetical protein